MGSSAQETSGATDQQPSAAAAKTARSGASKPAKTGGGLKRGFLAKPPRPKAHGIQAAQAPSNTKQTVAPQAAGASLASSSQVSSLTQHNDIQPKAAAAFSGNIVKHAQNSHQGPAREGLITSGSDNQGVPNHSPAQAFLEAPHVHGHDSRTAALPVETPHKRMSKFKQARTARQNA